MGRRGQCGAGQCRRARRLVGERFHLQVAGQEDRSRVDVLLGPLAAHARGAADDPLVDQALARDDAAVDGDLLAGRDQDQVSGREPLDGDLDLDPAGGLEPGEPLLLDHLAQEAAAGRRELMLVALVPELHHPAHGGPGEELARGQGRRRDARVEHGQPDLARPDLGRGVAEGLQVRADEEGRGRRPGPGEDEIGDRRERQGRVGQAEPDRRRLAPFGELDGEGLGRRLDQAEEPLGPGLAGVEADLQDPGQGADCRALHAVDLLDLVGDPAGESRVGGQGVVPQAEPAGPVHDDLPGREHPLVAIDRQLRPREVRGEEVGRPPAVGPRAGTGTADRRRHALKQVGHRVPAAIVGHGRHRPGAVDRHAPHLLDREDPQQEAAAELLSPRPEDLGVVELELVAAHGHADPRRGAARTTLLRLDHHSKLDTRSGILGTRLTARRSRRFRHRCRPRAA